MVHADSSFSCVATLDQWEQEVFCEKGFGGTADCCLDEGEQIVAEALFHAHCDDLFSALLKMENLKNCSCHWKWCQSVCLMTSQLFRPYRIPLEAGSVGSERSLSEGLEPQDPPVLHQALDVGVDNSALSA